ncbi:hypothetical protein Mapa_012818 [Marchantia paleacea]|nr:hypothetical protein Mapa_012818 [Marchantia paleacea]
MNGSLDPKIARPNTDQVFRFDKPTLAFAKKLIADKPVCVSQSRRSCFTVNSCS